MSRDSKRPHYGKNHLSHTQIKLLDAICEGKHVNQCLKLIEVETTRGVDHHIKAIKRKLGAKTLAHAVAIYCSKPDRATASPYDLQGEKEFPGE